ncbi:hypothetical protein Tco_1579718 [Tanacetum coccineum]
MAAIRTGAEAKQIKAGGFAKLHIAWRGFLTTLDSILPSGNVSFVYRNIEGLNRSIIIFVVTSSMLNPQFSGVTSDLPSLSPIQPLSTTFDNENQYSPQSYRRRNTKILPGPFPFQLDVLSVIKLKKRAFSLMLMK